ncbi:hypothetical protein [Paraflavitalea sp. CAU 1676]|uniref:hypothetical protein n=1 Tax=Paraflavitalea sp. CAU 1676 TaxID=3032598 RepID=UPI0023DC5DDF|nr:hypothetical protein [Paraflavitalea sp. CAU 1676]MDF2191389.1 hypothetical protein [Paraflavitalea sp. CAU 1676]
MCDLINSTGDKADQSALPQFDFPAIANGDRKAYASYCDYFYNPTFSIIARFSGIQDPYILCLLTESVFLQLWGNRDDFLQYRGGWLFRTTMRITIRYLKERGHHDRVQKILDVIGEEHISRSIENQINNSHETRKIRNI